MGVSLHVLGLQGQDRQVVLVDQGLNHITCRLPALGSQNLVVERHNHLTQCLCTDAEDIVVIIYQCLDIGAKSVWLCYHVHDHAGIYQISHLLLVEQAFVIYRYGASVFLHGEPCLAMLLLGGIVCLRGLLCSFVCIHSLRC